MKKNLLLLLVILFCYCSQSFAQAGVYLYIDNITTGGGTGVHANEVQLSSYQNGMGASVSGGFPPSPSAVTISDIVVTKSFDVSSLRLHNIILKGSRIPVAEIRFYNGQNVVPFSITLDGVFLTGISTSNGGDGCSTGCPSITETVSFHFEKITWRNKLKVPNQVLVFDAPANKATFTE